MLFGGDPARRLGRGRCDASPPRCRPSSCPAELDGVRVDELLVAAGLAKSNSEASRLLAQGACVPGNGVARRRRRARRRRDLLHGRYLLLRKGKRDLHLVGKFPDRG